jgi:AraC family transcriptional regulator, regulatory protein of adaptative response / methylated-DNA-[protein]-cysteine methyltransferase
MSNEDRQWQAVLNRDRSADGRFVYAVRSTRVYCRPSCPSRRPRRDRVEFFDRPADAAGAGFRPCRRCRPEAGASSVDPALDRIRAACAFLTAHADEVVTLERLARHVRASPWHLQRSFKRALGISPRQYAAAQRAGRLRDELKRGGTVTTAIYEAGYGSASRVYERATSDLGMTPGRYRRGGRGSHLTFTTAATPLGFLLVAATDRGICAVSLGNDRRSLERALRNEFPKATLEPDAGALDAAVGTLVAHLRGEVRALELPLDVQASAFQRRVWRELQRIPYGETRTYGEVARAIGRPAAARAVARACATNPVSLVVPCHRVVPRSSGTGGYRWGSARKERLLELETRPE